jgi:hypothetical protein
MKHHEKALLLLEKASEDAVEFRYDILPSEAEFPFDRAATRELVRKVRKWAEEKIKP